MWTVLLKEHATPDVSMAKETRPEPRWIEMPSLPVQASTATIEAGQDYHDLGELYADAPVARGVGDVIVHRAVLDDITGIPEILDWLSDGDKPEGRYCPRSGHGIGEGRESSRIRVVLRPVASPQPES